MREEMIPIYTMRACNPPKKVQIINFFKQLKLIKMQESQLNFSVDQEKVANLTRLIWLNTLLYPI